MTLYLLLTDSFNLLIFLDDSDSRSSICLFLVSSYFLNLVVSSSISMLFAFCICYLSSSMPFNSFTSFSMSDSNPFLTNAIYLLWASFISKLYSNISSTFPLSLRFYICNALISSWYFLLFCSNIST